MFDIKILEPAKMQLTKIEDSFSRIPVPTYIEIKKMAENGLFEEIDKYKKETTTEDTPTPEEQIETIRKFYRYINEIQSKIPEDNKLHEHIGKRFRKNKTRIDQAREDWSEGPAIIEIEPGIKLEYLIHGEEYPEKSRSKIKSMIRKTKSNESKIKGYFTNGRSEITEDIQDKKTGINYNALIDKIVEEVKEDEYAYGAPILKITIANGRYEVTYNRSIADTTPDPKKPRIDIGNIDLELDDKAYKDVFEQIEDRDALETTIQLLKEKRIETAMKYAKQDKPYFDRVISRLEQIYSESKQN